MPSRLGGCGARPLRAGDWLMRPTRVWYGTCARAAARRGPQLRRAALARARRPRGGRHAAARRERGRAASGHGRAGDPDRGPAAAGARGGRAAARGLRRGGLLLPDRCVGPRTTRHGSARRRAPMGLTLAPGRRARRAARDDARGVRALPRLLRAGARVQAGARARHARHAHAGGRR
eukprot:scaffold664_cov232-Prasinococcus_capsulatus_cf.AAC.2